jgi:hypothetical protein
MRLIQFLDSSGARAVGAVVDESSPRVVNGATSVRDLALEAHRSHRSLADTIPSRRMSCWR